MLSFIIRFKDLIIMFVVELTYKKDIEFIDQHVDNHRLFLDQGYNDGYFLVSGPQNPRTGGFIISLLDDKQKLQNFLEKDPFYTEGVADYKITEFIPVKYHPKIETLVT